LAALHNPIYRSKYKENLNLEFPRIPMYNDFWSWSNWGKQLQKIQANYELAPKYKIKRKESGTNIKNLKPTFKVDKLNGTIQLDKETKIEGIPSKAFDYVLGIRSAIEWILDQYKVKQITDKTVSSMFNVYNYEDYKEEIIELIQKVISVSLSTLEIMDEMKSKQDLLKTK
jgi:predicted helicase